jgi:hypothetical protein
MMASTPRRSPKPSPAPYLTMPMSIPQAQPQSQMMSVWQDYPASALAQPRSIPQSSPVNYNAPMYSMEGVHLSPPTTTTPIPRVADLYQGGTAATTLYSPPSSFNTQFTQSCLELTTRPPSAKKRKPVEGKAPSFLQKLYE